MNNGLEILNIQMCICELTVLSLVDFCVKTKHNPSFPLLSLVTHSVLAKQKSIFNIMDKYQLW